MTLNKTVSILLLIIIIVFILIVTRQYLLPFIVALLIWFFIKEIKRFINKHHWVRTKLPLFVQNLLVVLIIFGGLGVISTILNNSIVACGKELPVYEANIIKITKSIDGMIGFDLIEKAKSFSGNLKLGQLIQPILNNLSTIISNGFLVLLYVVFLMLEESIFYNKFRLLFSSEASYNKAMNILHRINHSFSNYFNIKTLMSFLTAFLSFGVLYFMDVDVPLLWAIIIFLLNFIPSIGSLIATIFPTLIAMLQNADVMSGIWVMLGVGIIQIIVGNVIEPRVMGNSLNISPLVVIIALVVWGAIWGLLGMFLSVPITVIMIIIFAQFPSTKPVAILLSGDGKVE